MYYADLSADSSTPTPTPIDIKIHAPAFTLTPTPDDGNGSADSDILRCGSNTSFQLASPKFSLTPLHICPSPTHSYSLTLILIPNPRHTSTCRSNATDPLASPLDGSFTHIHCRSHSRTTKLSEGYNSSDSENPQVTVGTSDSS